MAEYNNRYTQQYGEPTPGVTGVAPTGAGTASPFSIAPWTGDYTGTIQQDTDLWWDPKAGAGNAFRNMFGHVDINNPFYNRFMNQLAPGLATIYDWTNPMAFGGEGSAENQAAGWMPYVTDYLSALQGHDWSNVFGGSDISNIFGSILTGSGAATAPMQEFLAGATDQEIMSMLGNIVQTMGYTAGGPIAMKGLSNMFERMMAEWVVDAPLQPLTNTGNAFLNWISGSGWLDRLT